MKRRASDADHDRLGELIERIGSLTRELEDFVRTAAEKGPGGTTAADEAEATLRQAAAASAAAQRLVYRGSWEVELTEDLKPVRATWSPEMYALLGFEPREVDASPELFLSRVPAEERAMLLERVADCAREGREYLVEHRIVRPDGVERVVLERGTFVFDQSASRPTRLCGTCEDVTAREYRRSAKKYEQLLNNIKAGIVVHAADGRIESFNRTACEILGVDAAILRSRGATAREWTFYRPDGSLLPESEFPVNLALARKASVANQIVGLGGPEGVARWIQTNAEPVFDDARHHVTEVVVSFMDISEQIRARALVHEGAQFVRNVLDSLQKSVAVLDRDGVIKLVNESWREFARENGASHPAAFVGSNYLEVCARAAAAGDREAAATRDGIERILQGKADLFELEYPCHSPETERWFILRASPLGEPYHGAVVSHIDVTERRKAQRAFDERDRQVSQLIGNLPGFVYRCQNTPDWPIQFISDGVKGVLGYSPRAFGPKGIGFAEIILPEDAAYVWTTVQRALASKERYEVEYRGRHADGRIRWLWERGVGVFDPATGKLQCLEGIISDISERKELEEQFRQAQKMDVLGQLAGGVAHDFNNLLTVIRGHVDLLESTMNLPQPVIHSLGQIAAASDRAANLTRQLLAFSRKDVMTPRILDLGATVGDMIKMLRRMVGERYEITLQHPESALLAKADGGMLDQVLMNLVVNARDAMRNGGRIDIELSPVTIDETTAGQHVGRRPGEFARLRVRDEGEGIPPEVFPKIFEPFFTTKPQGKGTGLGLATVLNIVRQHQGWVEVESTVGGGSEFRVFLPLFHDASLSLVESRREAPGGSETILVVEDEDEVRHVLESVLLRKGYQVLSARSALSAYQLWAERKSEVNLLISDIVLPEGMSGPDLQRMLLAERPKLPVLFISGYVPDELSRGLELKEGENFLSKPFSADDLLRVVRARLDLPVA